MCGICGKLAHRAGARVEEELIREMTATLTHRGPDGGGIHVERSESVNVGLGHRRLSIIDLTEAGCQPMSDDAGKVWITYNGEIYNHVELRNRLEELGHHFRSRSDTEVVLKAYLEWGTECLGNLEGMFAFCIWDSPRNQAFVARDRVGIKPLYYGTAGPSFLFASELKAFLADPSFERNVDPEAVDAYLTFGYIPAPLTIYRDARKLLPGHYLLWQEGRTTTHRYWSYETTVEEPDPGQAVWLSRVDEVLRASVPSQMISDVPVGALLSGGIDSSLVVRMMSTNETSFPTSSIGFGIDSFDELPYARIVAERFGTEHTEHRVEPNLLGVLPELAWHLDEPFGDSSIVPTYYVCKSIRESVKVALSGDGGDELFAGYTRYQGEQFSRWLQGLPSILRVAIGTGSRRIPPEWGETIRRLRRVLSTAELGFLERYVAKGSICDVAMRSRLLSGSEGGGDTVREALEAMTDPDADFVQNLIRLDLGFYLPNDMLMKVDKMSMASSLEVRVPLLDESVVALSASMPSRYKLRGFQTKYVLRELAREVLPRAIWNRPKQGFGMPVQEWFRGELKEMSRDLLNGPGYFDKAAVATVLSEHEKQTADHGHLIFALLMFELWRRAYEA